MNFKLSKYLLALCLIIGLASCSEDERIDPVVGDTVTIELNIPSATSLSMVTRGMTDAKEEQIDNLYLLEFDGAGNLVRITPRTISGNSFTQSITLRIRNLVVLANVDASDISAIPANVSYSAVKAVLKETLASATIGWDVTKSIPMWGEAAITSSTSGTVTIDLFRMLARINVEVSLPISDFELTSVHLRNTNQSGFVVSDLDGSNNAVLTPETSAGLSNIAYSGSLVAGNAMVNEIYTFETAAGTDLVGDPCLIIGGKYNGGPETYYRVNFHDGSDHLAIKRNHSYNFDIKKVLKDGYPTPGEAYNDKPINIVYDVVLDDSNSSDIVFDGQYYITVNKSSWELPEAGILSNNEAYKIILKTNYPISDLEVEVTDGSSWLTINDSDIENIYIIAASGGTLRTGTITIKAGRLSNVVHITQKGIARFTTGHSGWAGSNIYWNGSTLTFDDTPADPANPTDIEKKNWQKQGVFFQWGSLWGLDPSSPENPWSGTVYLPSGSGYERKRSLGWTGMPRVDDTTNPGNDRERAYLYEITNASVGIGDICKYLTEIGSAPAGKRWRMPTSEELGDSEPLGTADADRYYYFTPIADAFYLANRNDGQFEIAQGAYKIETAGGSQAGPRTFFPASGFRMDAVSMAPTGYVASYWSSSAAAANPHIMGDMLSYYIENDLSSFYWGPETYSGGNPRFYALPVRCVAE
jgi:Protein of unknown function (DUF1812).